jgi:hypothetical protein
MPSSGKSMSLTPSWLIAVAASSPECHHRRRGQPQDGNCDSPPLEKEAAIQFLAKHEQGIKGRREAMRGWFWLHQQIKHNIDHPIAKEALEGNPISS